MLPRHRTLMNGWLWSLTAGRQAGSSIKRKMEGRVFLTSITQTVCVNMAQCSRSLPVAPCFWFFGVFFQNGVKKQSNMQDIEIRRKRIYNLGLVPHRHFRSSRADVMQRDAAGSLLRFIISLHLINPFNYSNDSNVWVQGNWRAVQIIIIIPLQQILFSVYGLPVADAPRSGSHKWLPGPVPA